MFVPPYSILAETLDLDRACFDSNAKVYIPAKFLKFLLQCLLTNAEFDSESYLKANPDIRETLDEASPNAAQLHFIRQGYFEGRRGGSPTFDEAWYLERYPDVARALEEGIVNSASDHYYEYGGIEWRVPNRSAEVDIEVWHEVLAGNGDEPAAPA